MALHPFLASLFFARRFLFGSFWGVSPDLRAKSRLRRLRSETRLLRSRRARRGA